MPVCIKGYVNIQSNLVAINERLNLALESARQVAFDWHIPEDKLHFSGDFAENFKDVSIDTTKTWSSRALPAIIHDDDKENFRRHLHSSLKGGAVENAGIIYKVELRLKDSLRGWRWVDINGKIAERDENGRALRMVGTFSDIDERKHAEKKISKLHDLYAAMSHTSQAIMRIGQRDVLLQEICRIAVEHGRFHMAWIGLINDDGKQVVPVASAGRDLHILQEISMATGASEPGDCSPVGIAVRANKASISNDFFDTPSLQHASSTLAQSKIESMASFPIQQTGKVIGTFNLHALEKDFFDEPLIDLLGEMARDISFALDNYNREAQREAMEAALSHSEQIKSAILTAALDCIISFDHEGEIISFNQAAELTFGYRSEDVLGKKLAEIIAPPEWRNRYQKNLAHFLATGESTVLNRRVELTAKHADSTIFPIELAIVPIRIQENRIFTAFIRDISDLKQSQAILKDSALRYRQLVELSPEAIFVHRHEKFILVNQAAIRLMGAKNAGELLDRSIHDFIHPNHHAILREHARRESNASPTRFLEQIWTKLDDTEFYVDVATTNLMYDGTPAVQTVVRDIHERKLAEALQLGQNRILNMIATGIELPEILKEIAYFIEAQSNRRLCSILLLDADSSTLSNGASPSLPVDYLSAIDGATIGLNSGSSGAAIFRAAPVIVTDIASSPLWATMRDPALQHGLKACSAWPIFGKSRKLLGSLSLYFHERMAPTSRDLQLCDISTNLAGIAIESRESEEKIRYLAHYDGLTSLPNRFLFKEYLDVALRDANRRTQKFTVFFLDLDRFKNINDTFGHEAGDKVLREIATRLRNSLRKTDKIARMGGDEFYILLEDFSNEYYVAEVAQKLLDEASRSFYIGNHECQLSVSIGIVVYPDDGRDAPTLLKNADIAMYRAKNLGKNGYRFYSAVDDIKITNSSASGSHLHRAIENKEFVLHYQPKIDVKTGRMTGAEALVRWQHPEHGLLPPANFLALAEETGLIVRLGKQILDIVRRDILVLHALVKMPFRIAINLSARQFYDNNLIADINALLSDTAMHPIMLDVETTEDVVMSNTEQAKHILTRLRALKIGFAIDDFGMGYSSLADLRRLPIDRLKIDRSFVQGIPANADDIAVTRATIAMAHSLELHVIAEGVETEEQADTLRLLDCDEYQGFYFCEPIPMEKLIALLRYDVHEYPAVLATFHDAP